MILLPSHILLPLCPLFCFLSIFRCTPFAKALSCTCASEHPYGSHNPSLMSLIHPH